MHRPRIETRWCRNGRCWEPSRDTYRADRADMPEGSTTSSLAAENRNHLAGLPIACDHLQTHSSIAKCCLPCPSLRMGCHPQGEHRRRLAARFDATCRVPEQTTSSTGRPRDIAGRRGLAPHIATPIQREGVCQPRVQMLGRLQARPMLRACCPILADKFHRASRAKSCLVAWTIMACIQKALEFSICDRIAINVEGPDC